MRGATRSCLVTGSSPLLLFLRQHHPQGEETQDRAVAEVAEHHGEQEGERDDGVRGCWPKTYWWWHSLITPLKLHRAENKNNQIKGRSYLGLPHDSPPPRRPPRCSGSLMWTCWSSAGWEECRCSGCGSRKTARWRRLFSVIGIKEKMTTTVVAVLKETLRLLCQIVSEEQRWQQQIHNTKPWQATNSTDIRSSGVECKDKKGTWLRLLFSSDGRELKIHPSDSLRDIFLILLTIRKQISHNKMEWLWRHNQDTIKTPLLRAAFHPWCCFYCWLLLIVF